MIASDPEYFPRRHIAGQVKVVGSVDETTIVDYLRIYRDPATLHAICEDYRASTSIDLEHDREDWASRICSLNAGHLGHAKRWQRDVRC